MGGRSRLLKKEKDKILGKKRRAILICRSKKKED